MTIVCRQAGDGASRLNAVSVLKCMIARLVVLWLCISVFRVDAVQITAVWPSAGASNLECPPILAATVTGTTGQCQVSFFYRKAPPIVRSNFSIIVLPDTQNYCSSRLGGTPEIFAAQTEWVVTNRAALNPVLVIHTGDIVQSYDLVEAEWYPATNALYRLEDPISTQMPYGIPYLAAPGNHDTYSPSKGYPSFNRYFGIEHFQGRPYYGGHRGTNNVNSYVLFSAAGMDFIAIALEYAPSADVLGWANQVLASYPDRRAIVASHSILHPGTNGVVFNAQGQPIYDALKSNPNLFLMLCGHDPTAGRRHDTFAGNTIDTLLADYEAEANGGNGWLRVLNFSPSNSFINVKTYSPWIGQSKPDSWHSYQVMYDMSLEGKGYILADSCSTNGDPMLVRSQPLTNLAADTWYEWYVEVKDGASTRRSQRWKFLNSAATNPPTGFNVMPYSPNPAGHISFSWPSVGGCRYRIEFSDGGLGGTLSGVWTEILRTPYEETDGSPAGSASVQLFTDDFKYTGAPPPQGVRFFRVRKIE